MTMILSEDKAARRQVELAERCQRIANLYIAYHNSGEAADVFGREFFYAVGDILNGTPIKNLEIFHINPREVTEVLSTKERKTHDEGKAG